MALTLKKDFGSGGSGLTPHGQGSPSLRDFLAALAGAADVPAWSDAIAVSGDAATLTTPGKIVVVEGTVGTSAGPKLQRFSASPAAGQVRVVYDADGVPTLTFNGTDAITECRVVQLPYLGEITIES